MNAMENPPDIAKEELFGQKLFHFDLPGFPQHREAILASCHRLMASDEGIQRSNQGGWHSSGHLHNNRDPEIQWMMQQVFQLCARRINRTLPNRKGLKMNLATSWININGLGDWNLPHHHLPSDWSGAFYIRIPETLTQKKARPQPRWRHHLHQSPRRSGSIPQPSTASRDPQGGPGLPFSQALDPHGGPPP